MKKYIACTIAVLVFPIVALAADPNVVINEIAWMGTTNSANDEWMELYNSTQSPVDLTGWKLQSADAKIKISLKGSIAAQNYYLLERTDNNSVPTIPADLIYKGALSNTGGHLLLYNANGALVDDVNFPTAWPAGNSATKQTMEKAATGLPAQAGWQTSLHANGTPKAANSIHLPQPAAKSPTTALATQTAPLPKTKKSGNNYTVAAVSEAANTSLAPSDQKDSINPWALFFVAMGGIVLSLTSAILLKLKIFKS